MSRFFYIYSIEYHRFNTPKMRYLKSCWSALPYHNNKEVLFQTIPHHKEETKKSVNVLYGWYCVCVWVCVCLVCSSTDNIKYSSSSSDFSSLICLSTASLLSSLLLYSLISSLLCFLVSLDSPLIYCLLSFPSSGLFVFINSHPFLLYPFFFAFFLPQSFSLPPSISPEKQTQGF